MDWDFLPFYPGVPAHRYERRGWYILWDCPIINVMSARKADSKTSRTLYIKNPRAHRLAAQVRERTGGTLSDAVISALEDKLRKTPKPLDRAKLDAVCASIRALPVLDERSPDEILG